MRYPHRTDQPQPTTQAVMFCVMDVSGSMDEERKDIAKRFFMLLYLFLTKSYEKIDWVFIRHHTVAKEVDEDDFFTSRKTGGTVVFSALELLREIIHERYPSAAWNIYVAQASDGDNWEDDSPRCRELLVNDILPLVQYYAYVEIQAEQPQSLWQQYKYVKSVNRNFAMQRILGLDYDQETARMAAYYGLNTYPNQIEIITSEQMIDAYSSVGTPVGYHHWSFGKHFMATQKRYKRGHMELAYEIVINSNPGIAYQMEENTMTMQALVIAHACYGHNPFFKGNCLFRTWADAEGIPDYLAFARNFVAECEERYGVETVEEILDSCHALTTGWSATSVRPSSPWQRKRPANASARPICSRRSMTCGAPCRPKRQRRRPSRRRAFRPSRRRICSASSRKTPRASRLEPWQREIVRKIAQYFYPQRQTQVMNEGWATFWHYTLLNHLYVEGIIHGFMLEFLHTNVIYQPPYYSRAYSGINPHALGFAMFRDLRRICEEPTEEDRRWFPDIAGSDWRKGRDFAMRNFRDESYIAQYLSPHLIREFKLFTVLHDDEEAQLEIVAIHDDAGYQVIRRLLADQYNLVTASLTSRSGTSTSTATARSPCATQCTTDAPLARPRKRC